MRFLKPVLAAAAVAQLALGLWMVVWPGSFTRALGGFGVRNDHYVRDVATLYLALGVVLLVAVARPAWRVPTTAFAALQYGLHTVNHLVDVGQASPSWQGPVTAILLGASTCVFAVLLVGSRRERQERREGRP